MEKRKIVLVDDEKNILAALKRILHRNDYELLTFDDPTVALDMLRQVDGKVDIIICDNKMPSMTGTDFLVSIKSEYPDIIRIMLTGNSDIRDAQKAINEGSVYKFLTKPCNADDLRVSVSHALAHKDLWDKNQQLLKTVKQQQETLDSLENEHPGISKITKDNAGAVVLDVSDDESYADFIKKYFSHEE